MKTHLFSFFFFQLLIISKSDYAAKLRLNAKALDHLVCPHVSRALNTRLRTTSIFAWNAVVDDSVSRVKIGIPPADTHCRYTLMPTSNAVRLFLDWALMGSADYRLEATIDLTWKDGMVHTNCNATVDSDPKQKTRFDEIAMKEAVCKELSDYFSQTPTTVVYPVWADFNLIYSPASVSITDGTLGIDLSTQLEPPNSDFRSESASLSFSQNENMIQILFDQNVLNMIFDSLYRKYQGQSYRVTSENIPGLRDDCGTGALETDPNACLGSFIKATFPTESFNTTINCDIKIDNTPQVKIGNDGAVTRASGAVTINRLESATGDSNVTLAVLSYRLVSRFNASVTLDKKVKAWTSLGDIALMTAEFEILNMQQSDEKFNGTTQQMVRSLAPILIDQINNWLGVGMPAPVPQSVSIVGGAVIWREGGFEIVGNIGVV